MLQMNAPRVASDTDNRNGVASNADLSLNIADNDAHRTEEASRLRGAGGFNAIAALNLAGVALVVRCVVALGGRGSYKSNDGEGGESGKLELHDWLMRFR
jgi:hypothetical protein